jgi:hypothetical protein
MDEDGQFGNADHVIGGRSRIVPWTTLFYESIPLPDGSPLLTLQDAAQYIQKLPQAEQDLHTWQFAVEMLNNAADNGWPLMMAHIAILRALGHGKPEPERKSRGGRRHIGASRSRSAI